MKRLSKKTGERLPSETLSETIDIDVTPVMNMFIILIPFLVSMAVFTHLSIIRFSLPSNVDSSINDMEEKPRPKPTIVLKQDYTALTLGGRMLDSLQYKEKTDQGLSPLSEELSNTRKSQADSTVIIASGERVKLQRIIETMDFCNSHGFPDIGLSSAPEENE